MKELRGKIKEGCDKIQINLRDNIINDKENSVMKSWKVIYGNGAREMEHECDEGVEVLKGGVKGRRKKTEWIGGVDKWTEEWNNGEGLRNNGI